MIINKKTIKEIIKNSRFFYDNKYTAIKAAYNEIFQDFTYHGSYPIIFTYDGAAYCSKCAKNLYIYHKNELKDNLNCDIYYEGQAYKCDTCNYIIESAYGDPDNENHDNDF